MSGVVRSFSPSDDVSWGHFRTWRSSQMMSLRRESKVGMASAFLRPIVESAETVAKVGSPDALAL